MANDKTKKEIEIVINGMKANASLGEMEKALKVLNQQFKELPKNTKEWKDKMQEVANMKGQINDIKSNLGGVKSVMSELVGTLGTFSIAMAAAFAVKKVVEFFGQSIAKAKEFQVAIQNLSAITGASGNDLKFLSDQAKEIGKSTTIGAKEAVEAFKLIASAKPELLENKEALAAITKEAIALAEASGLELPQAATALTDALNQFSAPADQAGRYINALAAGAKFGAAEIPEVTDALLKFGVAAKSSNISIEESVALIEALADKGLKGAEAGTALRNVLAKLSAPDTLPTEALASLSNAGVDIQKLSDVTLPLSQRLNELAKIQGNASAITRVFGLENKNAAQILIENRGRVDELTKSVTGTSAAYEQAAVNTDTYEAKQKRLSNVIDTFQISLGTKFLPLFSDLIEVFTQVVNGADPLLSIFVIFGQVIGQLLTVIGSLVQNFIPLNDSANTSTGIFKFLGAAIQIASIPLRLFVGSIQYAVDGLNILINKGKEVANFFGADFKLNPTASFETLQKNAEKNFNGIKDTWNSVFSEQEAAAKENTAKQEQELNNQVNNVQSAENKKASITAAEAKKAQKAKEKAAKEAAELAKKALEDELRAAQEISDKKIALISDEYERRQAEIKAAAAKEIERMVGTEAQKTELLKLIEADRDRQLAALQKERDDQKIQADLDLENRRRSALLELKEMQAEEDGSPEDQLETMIERMDLEREIKLQDHTLLKEEIEAINEDFDKKREAAEQEFASRRRQSFLQTADTWLQTAANIAAAVNNLQQADTAKKIDDAEKVKNIRIAKLDEELAQGKISRDIYDAEKQKAEDEYNKKADKLKRDQQKKNKKAALIQAGINMALGISSALQGMWPAALVFAGIAALMGGLQIAAIAKAPDSSFKDGGFTAKKPKSPLSSIKDIVAHFAVGGYTNQTSSGSFKNGGWAKTRRIGEIGEAGSEYVIPHWQVMDPVGANIVGYLEAARQRKRFAEGGFTDMSAVANVPGAQGNQNVQEDTTVIMSEILAEIRVQNQNINNWVSNLQVNNNLIEVEEGLNELAMIRAQNTIS